MTPKPADTLVDYDKMRSAIASLAKELLEIEATVTGIALNNGSRSMIDPAELKSTLANIKDVPVDIDPVSAFGEQIP